MIAPLCISPKVGHSPKCIEDLLDFHPECSIGRGTSGEVRLATDASGKVFAVKTLRKSTSTGWKTEEQFHSELDHPNIVPLFHAIEEQDRIHLIMEYCRDGDLERWLREQPEASEDNDELAKAIRLSLTDCQCCTCEPIGAISEFKIASIMYQMLQSIRYLHMNGYCHGDVHLKNFLLQTETANAYDKNSTSRRNIRIKLADFGVGGRLEDGNRFGRLGGTNELLAPEIARSILSHAGVLVPAEECEGTLEPLWWDGRAADMWALGVCLFMLLCGGACPFTCQQDQTLDDMMDDMQVCQQQGLQELLRINSELHMANEARKAVMFSQIMNNDRPKAGNLATVSVAADDLLERALEVDSVKRITVYEALNHDWMRWYMFVAVLRKLFRFANIGSVRQSIFSIADSEEEFVILPRDDVVSLLSWIGEVGGRREPDPTVCDSQTLNFLQNDSLSEAVCFEVCQFQEVLQYFHQRGCTSCRALAAVVADLRHFGTGSWTAKELIDVATAG